jgi:hypothetical protein
MELLDLLEQRVGALLARVEALAAENATLQQNKAEELAGLANENASLRNELEKERARNSAAFKRIEALVDSIKEQTERE